MSHERPILICCLGNHPLEPPVEAHYIEHKGFARPGRGINGRSGSSLVLRRPTGEIACAACIKLTADGIPVGQQELE